VIINICFHGIGSCAQEREPGEAHYWVAKDTFLRVLDAVSAHPHVRLSFDDGNISDVSVALPALQERGLRGSFFALAGRLDDSVSLGPSDLRELRRAGMSIGTHGWAHVPWRGLTPDEARRELVDARDTLADASGGPIAEAALPLGRYDRQLLGRLKDSGYRTVYTSDRLPVRSTAWLQARYSITADDTVDSVRSMIAYQPRLKNAGKSVFSMFKRIR